MRHSAGSPFQESKPNRKGAMLTSGSLEVDAGSSVAGTTQAHVVRELGRPSAQLHVHRLPAPDRCVE